MGVDPREVAREVVERVQAAPPTLGPGRLVCVDGPAGSGKTTLAEALAGVAPGATVVHCDELLEGWSGLPGLPATVEGLLRPLAAGRDGRWRRWDWHADAWAEERVVEPGGLLVLEGVGSWSPAIADLAGLLVWVEAAADVRLARWTARDGGAMLAHWEQWRLDEQALHDRLETRAHADLVVVTG
ncbi:uridine kinase [Nocardioides sp. zg-1228]|uniref:uridine kinase family protein n=1 Tax=Nocardioides sp. zg-1228 TaxID=2763008 RepID=UPI0016433BDD|nr:4-amino-4-deoxy-L-arabinose transferase [Nocardioides sp. zg-1228]MBC2935094.1 4-amino-4-deoxy-L-arabinose transferase [Nocardioides sp. zg-1228]QSF56074.1 4-amino-4-deoxy-L-arabinose transferase [Nocardioides sp. zg-1228]